VDRTIQFTELTVAQIRFLRGSVPWIVSRYDLKKYQFIGAQASAPKRPIYSSIPKRVSLIKFRLGFSKMTYFQ
jgi:hypothetical protein